MVLKRTVEFKGERETERVREVILLFLSNGELLDIVGGEFEKLRERGILS